MSWKNVSRISRSSNPPSPAQSETPVSPAPQDRKAEAQFILQAAGVIPPQEPRSDLQVKLDQMSTEDRKEDEAREGIMQALKQQYLEGKPFDEIIAESGIPRATLFRWRKQQGWDDARNKRLALAQKLADALAFYEDPTNTETAMAQYNLKLLLQIQGVNLAKLAHKALSGEAPDILALSMSDSLNKYSGMLEKLIKSDQSIKSCGVERKEVVHVQALDMDDAVRLALEMKKKGQAITIQEAMSLLTAQAAKKTESR